jgi:hypothetical protein
MVNCLDKPPRFFRNSLGMKPSTPPILITLSLVCFALVQNAQAVSPPPDGGYPGGNTAEGQNALLSRSTGIYNTAVGIYSVLSLTDSSFCTGVGAGTLLSNTADQNTATGAGALLSNTTGTQNAANGAFALFSNTTGFSNTASGSQALQSNTTGDANTANGWLALFSNTEGDVNTAIGDHALFNNTTGVDNTAVGDIALFGNITGHNNTALGFGAGQSVTTANNVICIGSGVSGENVDNSCYIGNIYGAEISEFAAFVFVDADGKVGTGAVDANGNKVSLPGPQTMLNKLNKQQKRTAELEATVTQQQSQIQALTAGLQKVSAQLEANKPTPRVVNNP